MNAMNGGQTVSRCKACGASGATDLVAFSMNIGLLLARREEHMDGFLCRSCVHRYFWRYTAVNFVGWLGLISLFAAPLYEIKNIVEYVRVLTGHPRSPAITPFSPPTQSRADTEWKWPTVD
jgi:hypothetical protein